MATESLELGYGYKNLDPDGSSSVDTMYGHYDSVALALAAIVPGMRRGGRTAGIKQPDGSIIEYWFANDNNLSDGGFVPKNPAAPVISTGFKILSNTQFITDGDFPGQLVVANPTELSPLSFEYDETVYEFTGTLAFPTSIDLALQNRIDAVCFTPLGEIVLIIGTPVTITNVSDQLLSPTIPDGYYVYAYVFWKDNALVIPSDDIQLLSSFINDVGFMTIEQSKFTQDITLILDTDDRFGKYKNGDTIPATGKTANEVIAMSLVKLVSPGLTPFSASASAGTNVEVGTPSKSVTATFVRGNIVGALVSGSWSPSTNQGNRLGAATKFIIGGVDNGLSNTLAVSQATIFGANSIAVAVNYGAGIPAINSDGSVFSAAEPAGTLNTTASWSGLKRKFFGPLPTIPEDGVTLRADLLSGSNLNSIDTFSFATGTTHTNFIIAIEDGKKLVTAQNTTTNEDLTSGFTLSNDITTVPDIAGNPITYKVYLFTMAVPYSSSCNINVTIANA